MVLTPTSYPFISFRRNSTDFLYNKDCITEDRVSLDIICVSDNYSETVQIAECIRNVLEYKVYKNIEDNIFIDYMILTDANEDTINDAFV